METDDLIATTIKMLHTTKVKQQLASSSVPSICFGSRIAVQQSSAPLSPTPSAFLTAETLQRHHVGTNYVIKLKQPAGHCVILDLFNILRTLQAESSEVSVLCRST